MQTFLPYKDFTKSAKCLDYRRLGKQRVECKQIVNVLMGRTSAWQNHPAVKMWRGHVPALARYGALVCLEWKSRGYQDSLFPFFVEHTCDESLVVYPSWLGDTLFHLSHQSNLLRKDFVHYSQFFVGVDSSLEYVWPIP